MGFRVLAVAAVATWLGSGCTPRCGEYEHQTGLVWDVNPDDNRPPESIDGYTLHEWCGAKNGSIGWNDMLGDGVASLLLDGTHSNSHVAILLTSAIFLDVYFQNALLQVGTTLTTDDLVGQSGAFESSAYVMANGVSVSGALLTSGEIEILDVKHDPFWGTDAWRMRFDVTYGEPGTSEFWYTAVGEDWIAIQ